ncbi:hypothetical protein BWI93_04215 [Siphonobacter sp. BAB-5385]|uniref:baeRF7 domain-containing protein n=1 Tax=Siphonobacter sp. BAB-5385 TaxID=1864822 RepID=UPI000B9E6733|nr:hypothetical protein [Siphonobacter sp. BAB-5385]OZI09367.1 hypothetical protein BWI93_04215 [Siphonobacter sp. BAB-5385]
MTRFNVDHFNALAQKEATLCVSLYTPTEKISTDGHQSSKIHFKNALTEARNQLLEVHEMSESDADSFLAEGFQLLDDQEFWKYSSDMLAYFIFDGESVFYKLPLSIESPICQVNQRPYLLPLIPELNDDGHFYLLVLNLKQVSLLELTRSTMEQIPLPDSVSASYTEEIEDADNQKALQHRSGIGEAGAMFHGQGSGSSEARKAEILQYYLRLSTDIEAILNQNPLPLVLAGVDYLIPLYKQASNYTHVVEPYLTGSYSEDDTLTLSTEAWQLMEPQFVQGRLDRKENYGLFAAKGQGGDDVETVILTALSGGVDTLFVQAQEEVWGTYDAEKFSLTVEESPSRSNYSLLNEAAQKTIAYGGNVYLVEKDEMPATDSMIAGMFRYPLTEVNQETENTL